MAWTKTGAPGAEFAEVRLGAGRLGATGVAIGATPLPYRLDYTLSTRRGFGTARLQVTARGQGWWRRLDLRRAPCGTWSATTEQTGEAPLGPPGLARPLPADAVDCDLGLSPLTNSLPVLRLGLLDGGNVPVDLTMAWVSVPDLRVQPDGQRYTYVRRAADDRHIIRYAALDGTFSAELSVDHDGLVLDYPGLARRLG